MAFRCRLGLCLLAAIAALLPSMSLAEEPMAPRATYNGKPVDVAVYVSGYGSTPDRENPPMRLPQALVHPSDWFGEGSQLAQAHAARPDKLGYAKLALDVDAAGNITACHPTDNVDLPVDAGAVCSDMADRKFLPALDSEGRRIAGGYIVTFMPRHYDAADGSPHPMFTMDRDPTPIPMMAPRVDSMYSFPPLSSWMAQFYREPQWQTAPQVGLADDAASRPLTAIVLFDRGAGLDCRVIERSAVAAQDNAACGYARSVLKPAWADASASNHRGVPLYVTGTGSETMTYAPDPDRNAFTTISDEVELRLITALTNAGVFPKGREASPLRIGLTPDAEGKVVRCQIWVSTGNDASDIAACRAARETVVMQPMEDIFGRMSEYAALNWAANPTPE